jgi:hypothetical protein
MPYGQPIRVAAWAVWGVGAHWHSDASLRGTYAEDCHETNHIPLLSSCTAKSTIVVVPSA